MITKFKASVLCLLVLAPNGLLSETPRSLKLSIQKVVKTETTVNFSVLVENVGASSIFLEEDSKDGRDLYATNIEQLVGVSPSWKVIGPHRDTPPASLFELKPGEKIAKTITLSNPHVDKHSTTRQKYPIQGPCRATIRYFLSANDWSNFINDPKRKARLVVSEVIHVPEI